MEFNVVEAIVDPHPHPVLRVGVLIALHLKRGGGPFRLL